MSVGAMVSCWGPEFPCDNPSERLVALAIADALSPDSENNQLVKSARVFGSLASKTGLNLDQIHRALATLVFLDVLTDEGSYYEWRL